MPKKKGTVSESVDSSAPGFEDQARREQKSKTARQRALPPTTLPTIAAVRTISRNLDRSVFSWNQDPLALEIQISAPGKLSSQIPFDANFQVVDYATNVVRRNIWLRNLRPQPGNFPIRHGDNSLMTPQEWGLGAGLYLFRAVLEIQQMNSFVLFQDGILFRVR